MLLNVEQRLFHALRPLLGVYVAEQAVRNHVEYRSRTDMRARLDHLTQAGFAAPPPPSVEQTERLIDDLKHGLVGNAMGGMFLWNDTPQGVTFWNRQLDIAIEESMKTYVRRPR